MSASLSANGPRSPTIATTTTTSSSASDRRHQRAAERRRGRPRQEPTRHLAPSRSAAAGSRLVGLRGSGRVSMACRMPDAEHDRHRQVEQHLTEGERHHQRGDHGHLETGGATGPRPVPSVRATKTPASDREQHHEQRPATLVQHAVVAGVEEEGLSTQVHRTRCPDRCPTAVPRRLGLLDAMMRSRSASDPSRSANGPHSLRSSETFWTQPPRHRQRHARRRGA